MHGMRVLCMQRINNWGPLYDEASPSLCTTKSTISSRLPTASLSGLGYIAWKRLRNFLDGEWKAELIGSYRETPRKQRTGSFLCLLTSSLILFCMDDSISVLAKYPTHVRVHLAVMERSPLVHSPLGALRQVRVMQSGDLRCNDGKEGFFCLRHAILRVHMYVFPAWEGTVVLLPSMQTLAK